MKAGFAKVDITPRVGVEMCGFGPYLNRRAVGVRDRLWARAMALSDGDRTLVLVECDLIATTLEITRRVRGLVAEGAGLPAEAVMVHCTHTHSGPSVGNIVGWGQPDQPYLEVLPHRIARACLAAVAALGEARLSYARVPCEGIGLNREYDKDAPPLDDVLREDWRPAKPELTDTWCHVVSATAPDGSLLGFFSSFGCHPVVCCQETRYLHGDYAGVATNLIEREHPGAVGLFLQGAQGDVNSCVVHKPEFEALLALDVIAARYARCVRAGLAKAAPFAADRLACALREATFSRLRLPAAELRAMLAEKELLFAAPEASDADNAVRMATVYAVTLRRLIRIVEEDLPHERPTEVQGFRIGDLALLGAPFETFQAIKNDICAGARSPIPVFMGLTNDLLGYAVDRATAVRGGYAAQRVPIMLGSFPFADIHTELVRETLALDAALHAE